MSSDVYLDFSKDNDLDNGETIRIGHLSMMSYHGPLLEEFRITNFLHPILTQEVIDVLAGYSTVFNMYLNACLSIPGEDFIDIFGTTKTHLNDYEDNLYWDWPDEEFIRDELLPFIGMKWRTRVD